MNVDPLLRAAARKAERVNAWQAPALTYLGVVTGHLNDFMTNANFCKKTKWAFIYYIYSINNFIDLEY